MEEPMVEDKAEPRADIASGIYGTILVTAVVAGAYADPHLSAWSGSVVVLVTALVFWVAHVYANLMALHHSQRRRSSWTQVREMAWQEWPLVQAGVLPILTLLHRGHQPGHRIHSCCLVRSRHPLHLGNRSGAA